MRGLRHRGAMPAFYALVDALTGLEAQVETALRGEPRVLGVAPCKERNHDFLLKFDAVDFQSVDDFLQTYLRPIHGVASVEIVVDWRNHPPPTLAARDALG